MSNATVPQTAAPAPTYRLIGRTLIMQSSTNPRLSYTVTDRGCTCKAGQFGKACRHQRQRSEVLAARAARPRMSDAEYTAACAAADELF